MDMRNECHRTFVLHTFLLNFYGFGPGHYPGESHRGTTLSFTRGTVCQLGIISLHLLVLSGTCNYET